MPSSAFFKLDSTKWQMGYYCLVWIPIFTVHSLSVGMKIKLVKSVKIYYSANLAFHLSQGFKIETYDDIETAWL